MESDIAPTSQPLTLKRTLQYRDLILYSIILVQPTAPMPVFGVIYKESRGHVVLAILAALIAMLFTAYSYGRMARVYPQGGLARRAVDLLATNRPLPRRLRGLLLPLAASRRNRMARWHALGRRRHRLWFFMRAHLSRSTLRAA